MAESVERSLRIGVGSVKAWEGRPFYLSRVANSTSSNVGPRIVDSVRASRCLLSLLVAVGLGVTFDLAGGCTSFQAADNAEGGAPGTSSSQQGIRCGNGRCAPPNVCCFEADGGTESCTPSASCTGAPLECITTVDCVDAGTPAGTVCCAYDDGMQLQRSACVQGSACDPAGPRDWLCDPKLAAGSECTQPGFTNCKAYPYPSPYGFALCAQP